MIYREYPPHPALRAHVACLWTARVTAPASAAAPHVHRVLPDNCVDIIWQDSQAAAFAVGMMSRPIVVQSSRPVRTVAVRFKPGSAALFLGMPLHELQDERGDLPAIWGHAVAGRIDDALWSRDIDDAQRLALVETELLRRLATVPTGTTAFVSHAVAAIEASRGELRIDAVADRLGVSRQHLALRFRQQVGLGPKLFARICRFRRALALLREPGRTGDLAALAAECGYFDQSHLVRDFQDFAHMAPGKITARE